jgi:2-keto-4-pentenoate hydratase
MQYSRTAAGGETAACPATVSREEPMRRSAAIVIAFSALLAAAGADAACPTRAEADARAAAWLAKQPVASYGEGLSVADAYCAQDLYVARLEAALGPRIGYKVGFTGKASQERFGVPEPARGVLFAPMILETGAELPASFGVRGLYEADLIVTIADGAVMDAATPLEAAAALESVVPFIELPDIVVPQGQVLDGPNIIALNVMPRYGVVGPGIPVEANAAFVAAFADFDAILTDETGAAIARSKGSALLGNPLNALLWLVRNLRASGLALQAGDMISLGSLGKIYPPEAGKTITLRYEGLPGGPSAVRVRFR